MMGHLLLLFLGGAFIYVGAEGLVWGGSKLAHRFKVSPIVVGLSVVAFGTSLPEFTVSLYSVFHDVQDIAIGNITGSNIANIALILALSAIIFPISSPYAEVRKDLYVVILITALFMLLAMDGLLSRVDGGLLVAGMAAYLYRLVKSSRVETEISADRFGLSHYSAALIIGLAILVWGTTIFTNSAIYIAQLFHVPELVIGATIVAVGTSLPELATSLVAAFRKESGIVLGNILGSNVFNLMAVLGVIPLIKPVTVARDAIIIQMPLMLALLVLLIPILKYSGGVSRGVGLFLLAIYVAFTIYIYGRGVTT